MSAQQQALLALVSKLSVMRGQGNVSADDWIAAFGDDLLEVRADAPDPVGAVREWVQRNDWRPSVAELWRMVDEQRQARGQGQTEQRESGCPDCTSGYRTGRSLRRLPGGAIVEREATVPCTCERGMRIARALAGSERMPFTWREQAAMLREERIVTRASGEPGLLGWGITDRRWAGWDPELYADPAARRELLRRAALRGERLARALMGDGGRLADADRGRVGHGR